jgi:hypothetical protein
MRSLQSICLSVLILHVTSIVLSSDWIVQGWSPQSAGWIRARFSPSILAGRRWPREGHLRSHDPVLAAENTPNKDADGSVVAAVVAPLQYLGRYTGLALLFPNFPDASLTRKSSNLVNGSVKLTFLLDTGATVNTVDARVAAGLPVALPFKRSLLAAAAAAGLGGSLRGGDYMLLGDCRLAGMPPGQDFLFMSNLTAAALPYASPVGQGVLGLSFFECFPAGVEFDWYGTDGDPPTIIFYTGDQLPDTMAGTDRMECIALHRLPPRYCPSQLSSMVLD